MADEVRAVTCRPDPTDPEFCDVHEDGMFGVGEPECDVAALGKGQEVAAHD